MTKSTIYVKRNSLSINSESLSYFHRFSFRRLHAYKMYALKYIPCLSKIYFKTIHIILCTGKIPVGSNIVSVYMEELIIYMVIRKIIDQILKDDIVKLNEHFSP